MISSSSSVDSNNNVKQSQQQPQNRSSSLGLHSNSTTSGNVGIKPSPPPRLDVGEVGRVLLSSTMLGYDAALNAAKRHVFENQQTSATSSSNISVTNSTYRPPTLQKQQQEQQQQSEQEYNSDKSTSSHKKKKKKKKSASNNNGVDGTLTQAKEVKSKLEETRDEIRLQTERFFQLAGENEALLVTQLEKLKSQNRALEFDAWKAQTLSSLSHGGPTVSSSASPRWVTPKESGYDSDSTTTSITTTTSATANTPDIEIVGRGVAASMLLKGRAQERVLSQAREAISRAANLCQILADPKQPGSLERRDVLIRAFRAITTDVSTASDRDHFPFRKEKT
jgi:hypothetical protein